MKHDWEYRGITVTLDKSDFADYKCKRCKHEISICLEYAPNSTTLELFGHGSDCKGSSEIEGCPACAGRLVMIRGRYPGDDKRKVCPTCLKETLEYLSTALTQDSGCSAKDV